MTCLPYSAGVILMTSEHRIKKQIFFNTPLVTASHHDIHGVKGVQWIQFWVYNIFYFLNKQSVPNFCRKIHV